MSVDRPASSVHVVVLAFNNAADTLECLGSVFRSDYERFRVIVVDNGSSDGTADHVRREYPAVAVVRTEHNLGVPAGFNLGVIRALRGGCDHVLLLNNDTIVAPDLLRELVTLANADPTLGIVMPKIFYYDYPNVIWSLGARYRRFPPAIVFVGLGQRDTGSGKTCSLEYAPSCGLLIPRQTFERVGLFDPSYHFYYDDWDFSNRVRAAGLRIALAPRARMWHKVSLTIKRRGVLFWRTWGESAALYYRRYGHPVWLALTIHLGYIVLRELAKGNGPDLRFFLEGVRQGLARHLQPLPGVPGLSSAADEL